MKHSTDRILTSHAGSLPRPQALIEVNQAKLEGRALDEKTYEARCSRRSKTRVASRSSLASM
jgi:5-methyltetrahydropteroyltriglutamate--homocysteine methyltransferase